MLLLAGSEESSGWKDKKEEKHLLRFTFDADTYMIMLSLILLRKESGGNQMKR